MSFPALDEELTPRIGLRSAGPDDAAGLFALIEADRAHVNEWIPWAGGIASVDEMRGIIEDRAGGKDGKGPAFCALYEGRAAGWASFLAIAGQPHAVELECWVGAAYQGRWIPAICGRRLIRYAFDELGRERLVACTADGNAPSARLIQRLGFAREALLEKADQIHGRAIDLILHAIERP